MKMKSTYDSCEEEYFSWYVSELHKAGYVEEYVFHPESYILSAPFLYEFDKQLKTKAKKVAQ